MSQPTHYTGIELDTKLLDAAYAMLDGQGDGRISKADARKLLAMLSDGDAATNAEKATFAYILEHFNWTAAARKLVKENEALQLSTFDPVKIVSEKATPPTGDQDQEPTPSEEAFVPRPAMEPPMCHLFFGALKVCSSDIGDAIKVDVSITGTTIGENYVSIHQPECTIEGSASGLTATVIAIFEAEIGELHIDAKLCTPNMGCKEASIKKLFLRLHKVYSVAVAY